MIPQSFIQDLLARVDVVEVVGRYVQLRKAGANFLGLCPFHSEKSPSFTVSPSKQFYHCFGCGKHGSAIGFLMEHAGLSYVEAIEELARGLGLTVPREGGGAAGGRPAPGVLEVLAAAARFYKSRLKESPRAIDYLKRRGIAGETAARYALGYAPDAWRGLEAAVPDYGAAELLAAGLVIEPESPAIRAAGQAGVGAEPRVAGTAEGAQGAEGEEGAEGAEEHRAHRRRRYDRFRDRIMFPIRNPRGQVIGFGARVIDAGEPKYLNSPETAVFSKGRELYGLYEARDAIRRADAVIVVEGYMDVVMLAQHGIDNAVATLGTATTPQHVHKLTRQADRVIFAFDGDAAGRKAAWRALEASLPHALDTKRIDFLLLPAEHDPDSFVRAFGSDGMRQALSDAQPLSEFLIAELSARLELDTSEGRARLQAEARPLLLQMPAAALRQQLIGRLASLAGVSVEAVERYIADGAVQHEASGARGYSGSASPARPIDPPWWPAAPPGPTSPAGATGQDPGRRPGGGFRADARQTARASPAAGTRFGGPVRGRGRRYQDAGARGSGQGAGGMTAWRAAPRAVLDLAARVRLVSARFRALADRVQPDQAAWLPEDLTDWLVWLRTVPADASFDAVLEALAEHDSEAARQLAERAAAAPADLGLDEATQEFDGAIIELQRRSVRSAIDALIARGALEGSDRQRYDELVGIFRALSAQRMV